MTIRFAFSDTLGMARSLFLAVGHTFIAALLYSLPLARGYLSPHDIFFMFVVFSPWIVAALW